MLYKIGKNDLHRHGIAPECLRVVGNRYAVSESGVGCRNTQILRMCSRNLAKMALFIVIANFHNFRVESKYCDSVATYWLRRCAQVCRCTSTGKIKTQFKHQVMLTAKWRMYNKQNYYQN